MMPRTREANTPSVVAALGAPRGARVIRWLASALPRFRGRNRALLMMASILNPISQRFAAFKISSAATVLLDLEDPNYRALYFLGFYEPDVQRAIEMLLKPGEVFVDCGANIGLYSCLAAGIVGRDGVVMSFEPQLEVAAITQANIDVNRFDHVVLTKAAVSDSAGTAYLHRTPNVPHGHTSLREDPSMKQEVVPCALVRLDDAVPRGLWPRVSLIKLDIEGAELAALRGAISMLRESKANLIVEINPSTAHRSGYRSGEIFSLLSGLGYLPYVWTDQAWTLLSRLTDDLTANVLFRHQWSERGSDARDSA